MYENLMRAMCEDCLQCRDARNAAAVLWNALAYAPKSVMLLVQHTDDSGEPFANPVRACRPRVYCPNCNDTGRVLSHDGRQLLAFLESHSVMSGAELDRRVLESQKGGADDSHG